MLATFSREAVDDSIRKRPSSDPASACAQMEVREWKYRKKSVGGGLVCKL